MTKELEALDWLKTECYVESPQDEIFEKYCDVIEKALLELKAIKEAKPSEAINSLNKLWSTFISSTRTSEKYVEENPFVIRHIKDYDTIKQALLKQLSGSQYTNIFIDEAVKPSEAMECLNDMERDLYVGDYYKNNIAFTKQALLKAEKLENAWEVVKEKNVNIGHFYFMVFILKKDYESCKLNNNNVMYNICDTEKEFLTQQEFDLLKEMLK